MVKSPSNDSFTSSLGTGVMATQLAPAIAQRQHRENWKVYNDSEEEDEREPDPLIFKNVFN
jgi:hypothetical protein